MWEAVKFETSAAELESAPDSILSDLVKKESEVCPYNLDGRSCYYIPAYPKTFPCHTELPTEWRQAGVRRPCQAISDQLRRLIGPMQVLRVEVS